MKTLGALLEWLTSWTKGRVAVGERNNTPEMRSNAEAADAVKAADITKQHIVKATDGDAAALEGLRRELGE